MTLNEMIEKRKKLIESALSFANLQKNSEGMLSEDSYKIYRKMETEIENISREIQQKRQDQIEEEFDNKTKIPFQSTKQYKYAMLDAVRSNFRNVSDILREGVDTDGGFLVPDEYDSRIVDILGKESIIRRLATNINISVDHKINVAVVRPAAAWTEEGEIINFGNAGFGQISLNVHKLNVALKITEDLLYDNAFNLEKHLLEQFGTALAEAEDNAFLNGSGNGKPVGIFAENGGGTVSVNTSELKADNFIDLVYSLNLHYRKNAVFIMNDNTLTAVKKLKDSTGAYIWQPDYRDSEPDRLLGYKVYTSEFAPENKVAFGDFRYYNIGDRGSRAFKKLPECFAEDGMVVFIMKERVDGKLALPEAVQIMNINK